jgi:hypothetical protein
MANHTALCSLKMQKTQFYYYFFVFQNECILMSLSMLLYLQFRANRISTETADLYTTQKQDTVGQWPTRYFCYEPQFSYQYILSWLHLSSPIEKYCSVDLADMWPIGYMVLSDLGGQVISENRDSKGNLVSLYIQTRLDHWLSLETRQWRSLRRKELSEELSELTSSS